MDPQAQVIMCSAMGHNTYVKECIQAGACDFIVKPFERERVMQALRQWLS
ncbi:MAG: response regulator [Heliobacteriaceae bacterium]|nr:response regulator [Heliobacteriaceae bacterium]